MPRRPDLSKASLCAGLICLILCLAVPEGTAAENPGVCRVEADRGGQALPSQPLPLLLAQRTAPPGVPAPKSGGSGSSSRLMDFLVRFVAGGILGPLLWYYVFSYPLALFWHQGLWPPGMLDLVVAFGVGHVGYRQYVRWRERKSTPEPAPTRGFLRPESQTPSPLLVAEEAQAGVAAIMAQDPQFTLQKFREEVRQLLQEVYTAWNFQQVESLNGRVKEGLLDYLRMGLRIMALREELSRLEDLALEDITIISARSYEDQDFITLRFRGWVMDYVLDRVSGKLLAGSMAYPNIFLEVWELGRTRGRPWMLLDIREH
uniref:Tim44-like domain-containing protein n=1 Tax=Desulfobacca acetoxidans TaxID=60893 RepID=A0A7V4LCP8_9BACT